MTKRVPTLSLTGWLLSRVQGHRYFTLVQNQARHDFYRPAQGIGCVTGAFHERQKFYHPCFFLWTLKVKLIGEPPTGRRNIGKAEFSSLIEFSYNR